MSRLQANSALQFEPSLRLASIGHLLKVFEQSDAQAQLARLNLKL